MSKRNHTIECVSARTSLITRPARGIPGGNLRQVSRRAWSTSSSGIVSLRLAKRPRRRGVTYLALAADLFAERFDELFDAPDQRLRQPGQVNEVGTGRLWDVAMHELISTVSQLWASKRLGHGWRAERINPFEAPLAHSGIMPGIVAGAQAGGYRS